MPTVTTTGNIDKGTFGFDFLGYSSLKQGLMFSGSTLPTTLQVGMIDEAKNFVPFDGGTISALPTSFIVNSIPDKGLVINVTGGSPNFTVSSAGKSGPLTR